MLGEHWIDSLDNLAGKGSKEHGRKTGPYFDIADSICVGFD